MTSLGDSSRTRWIAYETYTDAKNSSMERLTMSWSVGELSPKLTNAFRISRRRLLSSVMRYMDRPRRSFPIMYFLILGSVKKLI